MELSEVEWKMPVYPKPDIIAALTDAAHQIERRGELMRGNLRVDKNHRRALWSLDVAKARLLRDLARKYSAPQ